MSQSTSYTARIGLQSLFSMNYLLMPMYTYLARRLGGRKKEEEAFRLGCTLQSKKASRMVLQLVYRGSDLGGSQNKERTQSQTFVVR